MTMQTRTQTVRPGALMIIFKSSCQECSSPHPMAYNSLRHEVVRGPKHYKALRCRDLKGFVKAALKNSLGNVFVGPFKACKRQKTLQGLQNALTNPL